MEPGRLKTIPLFAGLSKRDLQRLGAWTDELEVAEGKHLVRQGNFAYEFFIIEQGTADVIQDGELLTTLGPGDFFGEIGLMATEKRTASVVATSPMRLVVMTKRDFSALREEEPAIAKAVTDKLVERLARSFRG
jgi:CRP/FNR family cyclic AMP-dependent transcriptional regulator